MDALPSPPRGVRVLFSRKGETADELIRQLVRAEPAGRPVVVISSDREVADGVRRHGAYPLELRPLLRRLARLLHASRRDRVGGHGFARAGRR